MAFAAQPLRPCISSKLLRSSLSRSRSSLRRGYLKHHQRGYASLSYEIYDSTELRKSVDPTKKTAVVLHGILGNHKNLRQISYKLGDSFPDYQILLATHRGHGESSSGQPPHTVYSCVGDLLNLFKEIGLSSSPEIIIGHSFGGKVALGLVDSLLKDNSSGNPSHCFVLDSLPGVVDFSKNNDKDSVASVISSLKKIKLPIQSKEKLIEEMTSQGFSLPLAQWMTLNVKRDRQLGNQFVWLFDLKAIESMLNDYCKVQYWDFLKSKTLMESESKVTFVQAERNPAWTLDVVTTLDQIQAETQGIVQRKLLKDSGHWVHVDQPLPLFNILSSAFED